jgi:two-component system response regulator (stage 0 sporulation protein A)
MDETKPLILLVEQERALSDLITMTLQRGGFIMKRAGNLAEARSILKKIQPLLVILDLFVPDGSGLDLLKEIQTTRLLLRPKVIVISSFGFQEIVEQAIQAGASDFILKPFNIDVLSEKVNSLIIDKSVNHLETLA